MTRGLSSSLITEIESKVAETTHLIEIQFSGSTLTWTTASDDIIWDNTTWTAIGGAMSIDPLTESTGDRDQGARLELSGVDQTLITALLGNNFRGRKLNIWVAMLDDNASVVGTIRMFRGFQNSEWNVEEERPDEGPGTVRVTANIQSRLVDEKDARGIQQNVDGHQGVHADFSNDLFFEFVRSLPHENFDWGER